MLLSELPVSILDNIINNINDTDSYANLRLSCKSCFYLMRVIKRYYNNKNLKEQFTFIDSNVEGYYIKWFITGNIQIMCYYQNSKKENEYIEHYPSGNIKRFSHYKNNLLHGIEKQYENIENQMWKMSEYNKNKKINNEYIYNKKGLLLYKKIYSDNGYQMIYYDNKNRIISGHFMNNRLHGKLIISIMNPYNLSYKSFDKIIKTYNYSQLQKITKYKNKNLLEKFTIKNGYKHDWGFKWYDNHKLKELSLYDKNDVITKLWNKTSSYTEYIDIKNNKINGNYKFFSNIFTKIYPFKDNLLDGYVIDSFNDINLNYKIKFKKNKFDHVIIKNNGDVSYNVFLDINYFSFTKLENNKKIYTYKLISNIVVIIFYDENGTIINSYSETINNMNTINISHV